MVNPADLWRRALDSGSGSCPRPHTDLHKQSIGPQNEILYHKYARDRTLIERMKQDFNFF